jgi:hypothetical protein
VVLVLAEVAVAVIKQFKSKDSFSMNQAKGGAALLLAACALPGLVPVAQAEVIPDYGTISTKLLSYHQKQADKEVSNTGSVVSPSMYIALPVAGKWLIEGSITNDKVSGASPRYHTSGASQMSDQRTAGDIRIKRYFDHATVSIGAAYSNEHDYQSNAFSISGTKSSEDNNTTLSAGIGFNNDKINPTNKIVVNEKKNGVELQFGVTQVITPTDIIQLSGTYSDASGYFSDPYKPLDNRPRSKQTGVLLSRWNHYIKDAGVTTKLSYRFYNDTFGIKAHTLGLELVKPLGNGWVLTPNLRYYSQSKASFYYDPPFPNGSDLTKYYSADQRLSSMGAITLGLKVSKEITPDSSVDIKLESYRQSTGLYLGSSGSKGLSNLNATMVQIGYLHKF